MTLTLTRWPTKGFFLKLRENKILPEASLAPK